MSQVRHADSKITTDVYAQLEQRAKRDHGANFNRLVRQSAARILAAAVAAELVPKYRPQKSTRFKGRISISGTK